MQQSPEPPEEQDPRHYKTTYKMSWRRDGYSTAKYQPPPILAHAEQDLAITVPVRLSEDVAKKT
jgi:hypothetical protein